MLIIYREQKFARDVLHELRLDKTEKEKEAGYHGITLDHDQIPLFLGMCILTEVKALLIREGVS